MVARKPLDELQTMKRVSDLLNSHDPETRLRVLRWLTAKISSDQSKDEGIHGKSFLNFPTGEVDRAHA